MGEIKKLLGADKIPFRTITSNMIWGDLCENIHLHYRNLRLDFSHKEWAHFRAAVQMIGLNVEEQIEKTGHREGDPNFLIQIKYNEPLRTDSRYYPNRFTLEVQKDNTVHMHYRDLRIHMTYEECEKIADMFIEARETMKQSIEFPFKGVLEKKFAILPIDSIQPYDRGHLPLAEDTDHRNAI